MLSKADIKYIKSLQVKKYRKQEQCFVIEGAKSVLELLQSDFEPVLVVGTGDFLSLNKIDAKVRAEEISEKDLNGLGEFQSNHMALAVARMKPNAPFNPSTQEYCLILDDIRDPGNLGTIIRTADWYGIRDIVASDETADFYNPKVISATMGSFTRVRIFYTPLEPYLDRVEGKVYGAFLDGESVHTVPFSKGGCIVIGNESRGISPAVEKYVTDRITIPRFGHAESLNAAIATSVICDNIRRTVKP